MTLIDRQIANRAVPRRIVELRILEEAGRRRSRAARGDRAGRHGTVVGGLAIEVAPRLRQRVVAAKVDAIANAIGDLRAQARVFALGLVAVANQVEVLRLPPRIDHRPRREIAEVRVEVGILPIQRVDAHRAARADLTRHAAHHLVHARRHQVAVHPRVHTRNLRERRRPRRAAVGVEPVEQRAQRLIGSNQAAGRRVDVRIDRRPVIAEPQRSTTRRRRIRSRRCCWRPPRRSGRSRRSPSTCPCRWDPTSPTGAG